MSHPEFLQAFAAEREREVARFVRVRETQKRRPAVSPRGDAVSLRLCTVHDDLALEQLAALESRQLPTGSFVIAEVGGRLVAATPLDGSLALADPFYPTADLLPLLRLRARQIEAGASRRGLLARSWAAVRGF